jgi:hypothetical protein
MYVFGNPFVRFLVSNDVFVIIALPQTFIEWLPINEEQLRYYRLSQSISSSRVISVDFKIEDSIPTEMSSLP